MPEQNLDAMDSNVQAMSMEDHVIKQGESDLSIRKYCQANGINEHTFRYWKTKHDKKNVKGKFKLVDPIDSPVASINPIMRLMHPNKTELHIYSVLDPEYIRQLM